MYKIVKKQPLNPTVTRMEIEAPLIAKKAKPGQFIILRVDENGERIPLTVAGYNREKGTVTIIFQIVGATTEKLNHLNEGECLHDFVGPLGVPTHVDGLKKVCVIGGGVGCAIALPIAEELHAMGAEVTSIIGFRNQDLVILEDEFKACSDHLTLMTDDGSYGEKGNVTAPLKTLLENGERFDEVIAIGPRNLALACEKVNARLIHISTDYVFPGTANGGVALDECAVPAPISAYGQTKLLGEQYVERFCRRHFIVRTAWLYSSYGKNFVKTMIRLGRTHDKITVVNDQLGNPTNAVDLAYHILKLAVSHDYGIYHCTGNGICSWYDFACAIMQGAGLSCKVEPVTSAEYAAANPASASRPAWSALENRMLRCTVGNDVRDWRDALACFFAHWDGDNGMKD